MAGVTDSSRRGRSAWGFGTLVGLATRSHGHAVAALVVVSLIAFLPGFFYIPPVDRDEARFAQATKQMIETGDYVDIRFQEVSRYKKPVGVYWLQAAAVKAGEAMGAPRALTRIWLYRIPSLLGAITAVLLTYWAALAFVTPRAALFAGLMVASSALLGIEARLATTDAVLLATTTAAMGALGRAYLAGRGERGEESHPLAIPAIFWTALAAGVLVKGPLILLFVALAAGALAAFDRSARFLLNLRPLPGLAWMLLLVLPWFIAIVARSGGAFFAESVGGDLLAKVGGAQELHWGPPGYYLALFWLTFFPAAMLAPLAVGAVWRWRDEPRVRFLLAWIVPSWVVFELAMTKLPHYVLPLYPAIAILIACVIDRKALTQTRWLERATVWWLVIAAIGAVAALAINIGIGQRPGFAAWPLAAAGVIVALFAWRLYDDGAETSFLRAVAAAILIYAALFGATFPAVSALFPSAQIARLLDPPICDKPAFVTAGHYEASLVFLVGTELKHSSGGGAADFLAGGACRFALVERTQERGFVARADAIGLRYARGPTVEGYNIATGRPIEITIFMGAGP